MSEDISRVIDKNRRRQQMGPKIIWAIAVALVGLGLILLALWLFGGNQPSPLANLWATETPTPTTTPTVTPSATPTVTPSPTATATITPTPTPSAPFPYTVEEGDSLAIIAEKFNLGEDGIVLILLLNPAIDPVTQVIYPGQDIIIPHPGMELPTPTPVPLDTLRTGALVEYIVQPGDSLYLIASLYNSTVEAIVEENELDNANDIFVGQLLNIPVNLVTPTPTLPPTVTPAP